MFIRDNLEGVGSICMTFAPFSYKAPLPYLRIARLGVVVVVVVVLMEIRITA